MMVETISVSRDYFRENKIKEYHFDYTIRLEDKENGCIGIRWFRDGEEKESKIACPGDFIRIGINFDIKIPKQDKETNQHEHRI